MFFKWKDSYNCDVRELDEQHKKLFQIGSKLYDLASLDDGLDRYDDIMEVIKELKEYTIYHFKCEENLMKRHGYSEYKSHKKQHEEFINKIIEFEKQDVDEKQEKVVMDMIVFIADWIENHILKTDLKYRDFFNGKGIY